MRNLFALLIAVALALASPASATVCRPTGLDITDRLANGSYLRFYPLSGIPHTASNSERDCMEWSASARLEELLFTAADLAPNAAKKSRDCLNLQFTRISVVDPYEGSMQKPVGAVWDVQEFGRHYQCEQQCFAAWRYELTSSSKRAAASVRFANLADLRNLLDVDPSFMPSVHAGFVLPATPPLDSNRAQAFKVDTRTKLPACGNGDCNTLAATHAAHACVTNAKCGTGLVSSCPNVGLMHKAYEDACNGDERCEAFRRMKPFYGFEDTKSWTRAQLCQLARLQDHEHMAWMQAQAGGDWKGSRKHDTNHRIMHAAMNDGHPTRLYVFMCDVAYNQIINCFGGKQNMQALLPKLVSAYLN
jgi:hypothetical protein